VPPHLTFGREMKKLRILIVALALVLATVVAFNFWHLRDDGNLASDESPFNSITLPLRKLRGDIWMDGGSVWVGVEDSKGASFDFLFPIDNKTEGYPTAFHGATKPSSPGAVRSWGRPLANPSRARAIVLAWLRQADSRDEGLDRALDYLSGYSNSNFSRIHDGIRGIFK
jgi:hypothetical protein